VSRVFVSRQLPGPALRALATEHDVHVWPHTQPPTASQLLRCMRDAEAAITLLTERITVGLLARCPRLKVIANYAVGYDNIDTGAAAARGVAVGNTPDVLTDATADLTFALLLAAARHLPAAEQYVRHGKWTTWQPGGHLGHAVSGATLLIIGYGRIGQAVAQRARGFSMKILTAGRPDLADLPQLLGEADYVSLHCPATPATRHLIGSAALSRMKRTAVLINTARGQIVDTAALTHALQAGKIAGAGLDVTDPEPLPPDHPLLESPSLVITPHIGSATQAARSAMTDCAVANVQAGLAGRPLPYPVPDNRRTSVGSRELGVESSSGR
jgi:glyoxylate reductase